MTHTNAQRAARLSMAIDALERADAWIQQALGACESAEEASFQIQNIVDDLTSAIAELDEKA